MYLQKLKEIYRGAQSWLMTIAILFAFITLIVIIQNIKLIGAIFESEIPSLIEKTKTLLSLYGSLESNATIFSLISALVLGILFAVHTVVFIKVTKEQKRLTGATGILGMLTGLFGVGCAACGSLLITGVFATGASAFLAVLPFGGEEFSILGIAILLVSLLNLLQKYQCPVTCSVDN